MHNQKYVFAQLVSFLDRNKFNYIVSKYLGDSYVKSFTCWNQLLVLMFGQLSRRESLRDLIISIEAHGSKAYHLGFGKSVTRSNLAKANQNRDYHIFEEYAYHLVEQARTLKVKKIFNLGGNVYAFDSTTIDLCLAVFTWATFRRKKGGVKVHTLYDIETQVPAFFHITPASVNDMKVMPEIPLEAGAYYIFDRGYNFFEQLFRIDAIGAFFVVRAKKNLKFKAVKWKRRMPKGVLSDAEIELTVYNTSKQYPKILRRVTYFDEDQNRELTFITNAMDISSLEVALLYKNRWSVELFFKWLKQHLKIKKFWGDSENAVRIQIYSAIIAYCLVAIVQHKLKLDRSVYEVLQVLGISLTDTTPLKDLFNKSNFNLDKELNGFYEPTLFDF
ncbi:MAG: IS4 family transposase [Bacteroidales bacterium]|nr:IS4 family transposase [Bacteroidales bacterium]